VTAPAVLDGPAAASLIPARGLSIRQPWGWAIARRWKPAENRSRRLPLRYAGVPVALHASKQYDGFADLPDPAAAKALGAAQGEDPLLTLGAVIAVAVFSGSHYLSGTGQNCPGSPAGPCSPWSEPCQWHWAVASVHPLAEPVPCRGALGFWPLPAAVAEAIAVQLPAITGNEKKEATA